LGRAMTTQRIFACIGVATALVSLFGFVLPDLFSARSTEACLVGVAVIVFLVLCAVFSLKAVMEKE
jgi:hypothetical protein